MKKDHKPKKKLQLETNTIRVLTGEQMQKAAGGYRPCTCEGSGCGSGVSGNLTLC